MSLSGVSLLEQAYSQFNSGDYANAVKTFTACLVIDPVAPTAYQGRATALFQLKDWNGAASDFKCAQELNVKEKENWLGLGMSLAMKLEIYPALAVLEEMLVKWPDFGRGYLQLGLLQLKLGAISRGKELLEKALGLPLSKEDRKLIQDTLKEQKALDQRRYYRPDFHALNKK